jgi:hypothetical protein
MLGIFSIIRERLIRLGLPAESIAGLLGGNIGRRLEIKRLEI